jgi:Flp pilus assembly protein TadG
MGTIGLPLGKSRGRKGIAVLATAATITVLVPVVGLAIDAAILYAVRARLSAAADAGALAGARMLARGQDIPAQRDSAVNTAQRFFSANFPEGHLFTSNRSVTIDVDESQLKVRTVRVSAAVDAPLYFMRLLGQTGVNVKSAGTATRRDVNLMLVLDRSGSLQNTGSCTPLKEAAKSFVSYFANGRDRLGLVSYAITYTNDFTPSFNFLSASPNINSKIDAIACTSGTNTSQALTNAWTPIKAFNESGALNVVVFFTDGQPNTITGQWSIKGTSTCSSKTAKTGAIALTTSGGQVGLLKYLPGQTENSMISSDTSCYFYGHGSQYVLNDVVDQMAAQDIYGNSTAGYRAFRGTSPYRIANYASTYDNNLAIAASNASNNAATAIKNDSLRPVIYSIGLGNATDAPAEEFMRRVANDPLSPAYDSAKPAGMYVYAPDASQLKAAFVKIASIILRLSE